MAGLRCLRILGLRNFGASSSILGSAHYKQSVICSKRYAHDNSNKEVKIGCASGFWGDTAVAAPQLIFGGSKVNYIVFDYLSEITMSLLTAARKKNPDMGYVPDFVQVSVAPFVKDIKQRGIKMVANAGGINPAGCGEALRKICQAEGIDLNIAVVTGDDLMPQVTEIQQLGIHDMDSEKKFPARVQSMNAYLGAGPIAKALDMGADIVITGRCTDSALVLGPLIHEFGWQMDQFDLMAAGSLAGHLIECGAQATGGIFTDWDKVQNWDQIGFPVVSVQADGNFKLTKPPKTGGIISKASVSEQLLYEIGNPQQYFLPDVVCDFSQVSIDEVDTDVVHVQGARGTPPSGEYKVCATYATAFRSTAACIVGGPRAGDKAEKTAKAILSRCTRIFHQLNLEDFSSVNVEIIGKDRRALEDRIGKTDGPKDCVLWLAVTHQNRKALEFFARELAPAGTGMAPGLCGIVGGRPKITPVLQLYSFLYPRDNFKITIEMNGETIDYQPQSVPTAEYLTQAYPAADSNGDSKAHEVPNLPTGDCSYRLEDLAYTRSGDKGDHCNIGVVARHPAYLPFIRQQLTAEAVEKYFSQYMRPGQSTNPVTRYDVPGVGGFNFLLKNSLGGGGIASLRSDPQGKAMGQELLDFQITDVPNLKKLADEAITH